MKKASKMRIAKACAELAKYLKLMPKKKDADSSDWGFAGREWAAPAPRLLRTRTGCVWR